MTGLGDVAYTGPPDATETTTSPTTDRVVIYIGASDVTLDGLTITANSDRSCWAGVMSWVYFSPLQNIKVTNCVIRHLFAPDGYSLRYHLINGIFDFFSKFLIFQIF